MLAVASGHVEIVQELLKAGADAQTQDWHGRTALTLAAEEGHTGLVQLLHEAETRTEAETRK